MNGLLLALVCALALPRSAFSLISSSNNWRYSQTEELTKLGLTIPEEFQALWSEAAAQLERELAKKDAGVGSLLAYLYWRFASSAPPSLRRLHRLTGVNTRFGREAGTIQRLLRTNDISWGTYTDPLGTHCNAHPNNFVLLPEVSDGSTRGAQSCVHRLELTSLAPRAG